MSKSGKGEIPFSVVCCLLHPHPRMFLVDFHCVSIRGCTQRTGFSLSLSLSLSLQMCWDDDVDTRPPAPAPVARAQRSCGSVLERDGHLLDVGKLCDNLRGRSSSSARPAAGTAGKAAAAVLLLSGSFNPLHRSHVACLETAKVAHEKRTGVPVMAAWIAPSSEAYVRHKLRNEALSLRERCRLCEAAVADSPWVGVVDWGVARGDTVQRGVHEMLQHPCGPGLREADAALLAQWCITPKLVFGADYAVRARSWRHASFGGQIVIGRDSDDTRKVREAVDNGDAAAGFMLVQSAEVGDVSATMIRHAAQERDAGTLRKALHPGVVELLYPWAVEKAG